MALRQNALVLVLLSVLMAIAADWSGKLQFAHLWCLPAGLLLAGLAYEAWLAGKCAPQLAIQTPPRWLLGRATPVQFTLRIALPRAFEMELVSAAPPEISMDRSTRALSAAAGAQASWTLFATARRLGRFHWPFVSARLGGALRLAWWPLSLASAIKTQVVPDILQQSERELAANQRGASAVPRAGGGAEVLQLREYRPSDPPRAIDWKASARAGHLISRDFSEDQHLEVMLALDVGRASGLRAGDSDRLTLYANVAARLAQRAAMLDDRVGLMLYADRPLASMVPGHGDAAVMRLRALLAEVSVQDRDANPTLAALRIRALARQRCLVVMLTGLDDASLAGELTSAVRLLLPKHLPFIAAVSSESIAALGGSSSEDEAGVYRALAAQEYRSTLTRNLMALRAMGAPAVLTSPRELDRAVLNAYLSFRQRRRI